MTRDECNYLTIAMHQSASSAISSSRSTIINYQSALPHLGKKGTKILRTD